MLNLLFQCQKPLTCCIHKPFLVNNAQFQTIPYFTRAHNNLISNIGSMMSQQKICVLSIRSTGSPQLSKDMANSFEFGPSEEEEEEQYVDDNDDEEEYVNGYEEEYFEEGEKNYSSFVSKNHLPPWGEVEVKVVEEEEDKNDHDIDDGGREADESFVLNNDDADDEDEDEDKDDVEGREGIDASFVGKKDLPPWGEVEGSRHWHSGIVDVTRLASKEKGLVNEQRAIYLEETDENVLSNRILVLSRTNKIRSAMEYFRSMELSGLCPNIHACNSLMSSLMRHGWFDDCFKVFRFTRTWKITTGHTYSLILMAQVKAQGCDSAINFFRELQSECDVRKDFDAIVYNTMISICRRVGNWSEIERVWSDMKANGCVGTEVTYQLLVTSFARHGQSELALYAYHEMIQNGFEPESNTLNAIVSVYAKEGKWDAASNVFQKMLKSELRPNIIACNALINSLGRAGELKQAYQVYNTMKLLGHKPDAYTFSALLSSLNKANRHHEALQLFEMVKKTEASQFNVRLYNTVLMSCSKLRLWDKALEILWQMEASEMSDLTMSYNLVIRTCELARKPTIALQVYQHMVDQNCIPNTLTYLSLVRCCVRGDLWEELEEILKATEQKKSLEYQIQLGGWHWPASFRHGHRWQLLIRRLLHCETCDSSEPNPRGISHGTTTDDKIQPRITQEHMCITQMDLPTRNL
ncbi:hypothetical protein Ahy_A04g017430 [Arachis hypogaea]|uniref:Pentacotripeptide-repeat region of PRORP domain-containing protein n=1 Tax=Arachis hypogaea TaxID=3818 RepID=A0A445DAW8_ARAHY|nr:hypothetical protein Ahy_A04g017430 [Arachis hypogaea]